MKLRRCMAVGLALAMSVSVLSACQTQGGTKVNEDEYFAHELIPEEEMGNHGELLEDSLLAVGNTARLHKAIAKAKKGEDVNLVYLGGSITEGVGAKNDNCYAYLSYSDFAQTYGTGSNVHYFNSGISGTPSTLGLVRSAQDVLAYAPDIVFVEFGVNDGTDVTSLQMYESLVVRLLESETKPAVILIFNRTKDGYSAQSYQSAIGTNYDLGMITVNDAITKQFDAGNYEWKDYSADGAHPNSNGHAWVAQMIGHYFYHAFNTEPSTYTLPETDVNGRPFVDPVNVKLDSKEVTDAGSFATKDVGCYSYAQGVVHEEKAGEDPLTIQGHFSKLVIAYEQFATKDYEGVYGELEIQVDGETVATLKGTDDAAWGNVATQVVFNEGTAADHKVTMAMTGETKDMKFNILDIVICE